jgi:DEAD/DEAH box helicase domain-containing protein
LTIHQFHHPMNHNYVVLDIETQKTFAEVGRQNLHKLKVSVVGTYDYGTGAYASYLESELSELEKRLKKVNLLIGFNIRRFDLPVLAPYFFMSTETIPVLDLMEEIEKVRGHRVGLHSVAQATLGSTKTGHGIDAVTLYAQGQMDKLKAYCQNDVKITKEVYEYGCENDRVFFLSNRDWKKYEIPVKWKDYKDAAQEASFPTSLF